MFVEINATIERMIEMGAWGIGIPSNDEYRDIYDEIMEKYNKGTPIDVVINEILSKYEKEYAYEYNSLYNLYFAAAYSSWECGYLSKYTFDKVKDIITTGKDIKCLQELGAIASDLNKRERALNLFLNKISMPKEKPKKPKAVKYRPAIFNKGDVLSIQLEDGTYSGAIVLENYRSSDEFGGNFIVKAYMKEKKKPSILAILNSRVYDYCWYLGGSYKKFASRIEVIGKVEIKNNYTSGGVGSTYSKWGTFVAVNKEDHYLLKENSDIKNIADFLTFTSSKIAKMQHNRVINIFKRLKSN